MNDDEPILIDGLTLAYEAFQGCRHLVVGTEALLSMLVRTLPRVKERDVPEVEVPASWARALDPYYQEAIMPHAGVNRELLPAIAIGAGELLRLWPAGAHAAIASLGYALHPFPDLVRSGQRLDRESFGFCFRIAAFCWDELSFEMRDVLCRLAGIEPDEAQRRVAQQAFGIDMFGFGRTGGRRA